MSGISYRMARKLYSPRLGSLLCLRTSGCQLRMLGPLTLLQLINLNLFFKKKKKINKTIAALQTVLVSVVQQHKSAIRSDQISRSVMSNSLRPHELQHARPPYPSPTPGVHWDSRLSSEWCHPAISSSVIPFSSCPQSLPASEVFPMSQLFAWGGQSTGVSALGSFLPKKSQGWSPSEWTGWISLQSKGLSRVFSNTTVQKHQFFGAQPSSQSNSQIHTWPQEKP